MWKAWALAAWMAIAGQAHAQQLQQQTPCPVLLVSGRAAHDQIELSFLNKGKLPIQQLSLVCSPPMRGKARDSICHTESGIFYPGTKYTMQFAYVSAGRRTVTITVQGARLGDGSLWTARSARACRALQIAPR